MLGCVPSIEDLETSYSLGRNLQGASGLNEGDGSSGMSVYCLARKPARRVLASQGSVTGG